MLKNLNSIEKAIIEHVANSNQDKFPLMEAHIPLLKVKSREITGVGVYVNFIYDFNADIEPISEKSDISLSGDKKLLIDCLDFRLNYEVNFTNGKFDYLELATNGEDWNGSYNFFEFV